MVLPSISETPSMSPMPSATPAPRPTRFSHSHTARPTILDIQDLTFRPTAPTVAPTINYWASPKGERLAVSTITSFVALVMILAAALSYRAMKRRRQERRELEEPSPSSRAAHLGEALLREEFRDDEDYSFLDANKPNEQQQQQHRDTVIEEDTDGRRKSLIPVDTEVEVSSLLHHPSVSWLTVGLFWILMLGHTGCMVYGLLSYWDRVLLKGSAVKEVDGGDAVTLDTFDVQVYIATFWINVKQFWQSKAYTMACLIFFSGVAQPIIQLAAVISIAYAPLRHSWRERMLMAQELTCKVPLSAFYVEAYLLVIFAFKVKWDKVLDVPQGTEYYVSASGDVDIVSFVGLVLFMVGQLSYLAIVNLLRLVQRAQTTRAHYPNQGGEALTVHRHHLSSSRNNPPPLLPPPAAAGESGTIFLGSRIPGYTAADAVAAIASTSHSSNNNNNKPSRTFQGGGDGEDEDDLPRATLEVGLASSGGGDPGGNARYGPPRRRPLWRRALLAALVAGLVGTVWLVCRFKFVRFKYTGVLKPYLVVDGEDVDGDDDQGGAELTLALTLSETLTRIGSSLVPKSYAVFYRVTGTVLLLANPGLLACLTLLAAALPDRRVAARRWVEEVVELLQCWCAGEAIVVATFFLVPNIELITLFVFDASDACDDVDGYTGKECLVVSAEFDSASMTAALVAYAVFAISASRLCIGELHGHWGGELLVLASATHDDTDSESRTSSYSALFR